MTRGHGPRSRASAAATPSPSGGAAHRAATRVVDLLELLTTSREGLALRDLSAATMTPKSSLLPLLRTLSARGYLEQGRGGEYRLGPKVLALGAAMPGRRELTEVARPALVALMQRTRETVFLGTLSTDGVATVYVDKVESEQIIRYAAGVGDRRPLHAASSGLVILAFLPPERREEILRVLRLERYTDRTIATLPALRAELEKIRTTGVCVSSDALVPGASGVSAPIFDRRGDVVGACVVAGPTDRIRRRGRQLAAETKATARAISQLLGYSAPKRRALVGAPPRRPSQSRVR